MTVIKLEARAVDTLNVELPAAGCKAAHNAIFGGLE